MFVSCSSLLPRFLQIGWGVMKPLSIAMRACLRAAQFLVSSGSTAAGMLWLMSVLTAGPAMANERLMPSEWRLDAAEYSGIACTESGGGWAYNGGVYHAARSDGAPGRPEQYFASYLALVRGSQCSMETACNSKIDWSVTQACEVEAPSSSHGVARCKLQGKYVQKCGWNAPYEVTFEGMVTAWKTCDQYYDPQSRQCVCPEGEVYVKTSGGGYCTPVRDRVIATPCKTCYGNPIFPEQGLKVQTLTAGWQPWTGLKLTYSSMSKLPYGEGQTPYLRSDPPTFGPMWTASIDKVVYTSVVGNGTLVNVARGSGDWTSFLQSGAGLNPVGAQINDQLTRTAQGFSYRDADRQVIEEYNARGMLIKMTALDGRSLAVARTTLESPGEATPDEGLPLTLTDHFGRRWSFEYTRMGAESRSRASAIVDPGGRRVVIGYGANEQISRLEWPDGTAQQMLYERSDLNWALTGYLDESSVRAGTYGYDGQGRAISSERALGLDKYIASWDEAPRLSTKYWTEPGSGVDWVDHVLQPPKGLKVQLPNGQMQELQSAASFGTSMWTTKTQAPGAGSPQATTSRVLDNRMNVTRLDDFNGNRSCMSYDMARNLETARVEGLTLATDCSAVMGALPAGARKVSTQWHPDWRVATKTAEPRRITTLVFNGQPDPFNGGAVASCAPASALLPDGKPIVVLCKSVEQATIDETGAQGFDATAQSGVPARATSWTYNAMGQVLAETDPRGKVVVTNEYYTDTTADHTKGDLKSSMNSAGHLTQFPRYNAYGKPLEVIDANLVSTTYGYDLRQRLTSVSTGGSTTSYEYWPTGLLKKTTQPDGAIVTYEYDDAHRLTAVADGQGNRIEYTLDASGNRTAEQAKDPQGTLKRTMSRVFDALGRAQQTTGRE